MAHTLVTNSLKWVKQVMLGSSTEASRKETATEIHGTRTSTLFHTCIVDIKFKRVQFV